MERRWGGHGGAAWRDPQHLLLWCLAPGSSETGHPGSSLFSHGQSLLCKKTFKKLLFLHFDWNYIVQGGDSSLLHLGFELLVKVWSRILPKGKIVRAFMFPGVHNLNMKTECASVSNCTFCYEWNQVNSHRVFTGWRESCTLARHTVWTSAWIFTLEVQTQDQLCLLSQRRCLSSERPRGSAVTMSCSVGYRETS